MATFPKYLIKDILLLTVIIGILFGSFLGTRPLTSPDEARYTEIPREMLVTGDFITPRLNYIKYFEKPALFYWMQAAALKTLGVNEWAARLTTALMALLGCLMTYFVACNLYNRRTGWLAALILATSLLYFAMAHFITIDMTVSIFLTASLFSFLLGIRESPGKKRNFYMWGMYIFSAIATLTKGLIGIIFPGMVIFFWLLIFNDWRNLKIYCLPTGILLWLLITLPWHILVQIKNPEFFHFYFIQEHFARYLTNFAERDQPFWYLPACLVLGFFPWIAFLIQAIYFNWPSWKKRGQYKEIIFLMLWIILIYFFFQLSHSQLPPYILPIFPPLALLIAIYFNHIWDVKSKQIGIWIGFGFIFLVTTIVSIIGFIVLMKQIEGLSPSFASYLSLLLIFLSGLVPLILYVIKNSKIAVIALIILCCITFISFVVSAAQFDQKSIKPLALVINPLLKPNDWIVSYHGYYQDLPVYTQHRVIIVGWAASEQEFGIAHQSLTNWLLDDNTFWKQWHSSQRMFVVMGINDYNLLRSKERLYLLAQTPRDVVVTNQRITP